MDAQAPLRQAFVRFGVVTVAVVALSFAWLALLSFSPADNPPASAYPHNVTPQNIGGQFGAQFAHTLRYYLGYGSYALLALLTLATLAYLNNHHLRGLSIRLVGTLFVTTSLATATSLWLTPTPWTPVTGPGGVLGTALHLLLEPRFGPVGASMMLGGIAIVGLLLAADDAIMHMLRGANWVGTRTRPALESSGAALSGAAASVARSLANAAPSVATAGASSRVNGARRTASSSRKRARDTEVEEGIEAPLDPSDEYEYEDEHEADDDVEYEYVDEEDPDDEYEYVDEEEEAENDEESPEDADEEAVEEEDGEYEYEYVYEDEDEDEAEDSDEADEAADFEDDEASVAGASANGRVTPIVVNESKSGNNLNDQDVAGSIVNALLGRRDDEPTEDAGYAPPDDRSYVLPPLDLLDEPTPVDTTHVEQLCREKAAILEQTLNEFGREVQVVAIETGPVITVFELQLAAGIKVSQIASLTNDMARALRAPAVRVVAPLPGKDTIGIEVPNVDKENVRIKDVIRGGAPRLSKQMLPLFLGKDAAGQPLIADLTRMPHLLIAGTTGSGKSVCASTIVISLLLTRTPSEVQMVLVDPKVVELTMFKDVPHLMCPIVTDMGKAEAILEWASTKMDERYALLAEAGVKDIRGYNALSTEELRERTKPIDDEEFARIPKHLPYLVILIDELADLMMTSAKQVEFHLCRIAQKSRAVGIHLIVSTQRPSANVVTGLIKANLPSRVAFRVASRLDSRIVLDQNGGEVLMGQGDMLFLPPGTSKLTRAQGTFIDDNELRRIVKHCSEQCQAKFHPELMRPPKTDADNLGERDDLFDDAVSVVVASGRGSVSLLQRKLTIGYGRASRLIEQMHEAGIVGDYKGSQAREVVITKEEWEAIRNQRDREEAAGMS